MSNNFVEPFPLKGRACLEYQRLFSSDYLHDFNFKDFYYENPMATKKEARLARLDHEEKQQIAIAKAKSICNKCPFLESCQNWGILCMERGLPLFGVTGGLTQEEQQERIKNKGE